MINEQMERAEYFDVTIPVSDKTPVWPGDPSSELTKIFSHEKGDNFQLSRLSFGLHTGTHVDAPLHFIAGGKDIAALDISKMIGPVQCIDFSGIAEITAELLKGRLMPGVKRVLFRTFHSHENRDTTALQTPYRALNEEAATCLVQAGVLLCGIDGMTIAMEHQLASVHRILLKEEVVILENLDLSKLTDGLYEIMVLPLLLPGAEAAPARVLIKKSLQQHL